MTDRPRTRRHARTALRLAAAVGLGPGGSSAMAAPDQRPSATGDTVALAMDRAGWVAAPPVGWAGKQPTSVAFARGESFPTGTLTLNEGIAAATGASFAEGQIDVDVKPLGYSDAGVIFHRQGNEEGEFVYLRANPDCPAAQDCVQYAPIAHGLMAWNIYPNYQGPAPISATGWNHLTIQVVDGRMRVYLNHAAEPSIVVPHLLGSGRDGGIALKGPAIYANLVVRPHARPDLSAVADAPVAPGVVTAWLAAPPTSSDRARGLSAAAIPAAGAWRPIAAQPTGLVDLGRAFGVAHAPAVSTGWLKAVIDAPAARRAVLHVGFAMQLTLFVNGVPVYHGSNPYYPEEARLAPDGRIGMDNAVVPIALKRGRNEVVLAVANDWRADLPTPRPSHYGWAAEARIEG